MSTRLVATRRSSKRSWFRFNDTFQRRIQDFLQEALTSRVRGRNPLLPPANEVCEGYVFYTCLSVILFTGGVSSQGVWRPPWQGDPHCAVHAGRYGQQAGGMHPTGMQFLFSQFSTNFTKVNKTEWDGGQGEYTSEICLPTSATVLKKKLLF